MPKLKNYNGRYCESDYENAFLSFLEEEGWQYLPGNSIPRASRREVLYTDDLELFLSSTNPDLDPEEIRQIIDAVRLAGAESEFAALHKVYGWMVDGIQFTPQSGLPRMVALIDFDNPKNNIFRAVNQFTVEYTNNGQTENRRPDILLFVNGIPLCVMELKNPADAHATIHDAWKQINVRYWRDISHLLHYCPLACISDGVKTRLGTVRTPYEHFYAWRRVNDGDKVSTLPFEEMQTMIKGVYSPERFLEIFHDYMARRKCYGYEVGPNGELTVNLKEAKVVRWIFEQYIAGDSLGKIAAGLEQQGIPSPTGRAKWNREAMVARPLSRRNPRMLQL